MPVFRRRIFSSECPGRAENFVIHFRILVGNDEPTRPPPFQLPKVEPTLFFSDQFQLFLPTSLFCCSTFPVLPNYEYSSLREIYTILPSLILHASSSVQNSREQEALVLFFYWKKCEKRDVFIQWPIRHDGAITSFSPHHNER